MRAAYDGIYLDLRAAIEQGTYVYKDFLPSESALVKRYRCAHNTVRKAIAILAREGFVLPIHGRGVRVIYHAAPLVSSLRSCFEPNGLESFHDAGRRCGFVAKTKVLLMETIVVDEGLSALTGFEEGAELVHMERVRSYDGVPLERETNYFRSTTVSGITTADAEQSVFGYIENVRKQKLVTSQRIITVQHADEQDRELLAMGDADYVAAITLATFDGEGILCEITLMRHHPDTFSFSSTSIRTQLTSGR